MRRCLSSWWACGDAPAGLCGQAITGWAAVVLAWVMLEGGADRRRLACLLWPHSGGVNARNDLRVLEHRNDQRLGADLLGGGERLELNGVPLQVGPEDAEALLSAQVAAGVSHCEWTDQPGVEDETDEGLCSSSCR